MVLSVLATVRKIPSKRRAEKNLKENDKILFHYQIYTVLYHQFPEHILTYGLPARNCVHRRTIIIAFLIYFCFS